METINKTKIQNKSVITLMKIDSNVNLFKNQGSQKQ